MCCCRRDSKRDSFCYALGLAEMRGLLDLGRTRNSILAVDREDRSTAFDPAGRRERERSAELFSTKEMTRLIQSLAALRRRLLCSTRRLAVTSTRRSGPVVGRSCSWSRPTGPARRSGGSLD